MQVLLSFRTVFTKLHWSCHCGQLEAYSKQNAIQLFHKERRWAWRHPPSVDNVYWKKKLTLKVTKSCDVHTLIWLRSGREVETIFLSTIIKLYREWVLHVSNNMFTAQRQRRRHCPENQVHRWCSGTCRQATHRTQWLMHPRTHLIVPKKSWLTIFPDHFADKSWRMTKVRRRHVFRKP